MIHEMDILVEINPLKGGTHPLFGLTDWNNDYSPLHPNLDSLIKFNRVKNTNINDVRKHTLFILNILEKTFPYCYDFKIIKKQDEIGNSYFDLIGLIETKTEINLFSWNWLYQEMRVQSCYKMTTKELQAAIEEMNSLIRLCQIHEDSLKDLKLKVEIFQTIYLAKKEAEK